MRVQVRVSFHAIQFTRISSNRRHSRIYIFIAEIIFTCTAHRVTLSPLIFIHVPN